MHANDPFALFRQWLDDARSTEPNDPNAMTLATVDETGLPDARVVLLNGLDERGFAFFTNLESAKGRELQAAPRAALVFHWKSLRRQVRVRGAVERVTEAEADAYHKTRPYGSRIGAHASQQSRPLDARETLENAVKELSARYPEAGGVPRPAHWSGFRVVPSAIEFWHDRPYRLHDRLVFRRPQTDAPWHTARLYP